MKRPLVASCLHDYTCFNEAILAMVNSSIVLELQTMSSIYILVFCLGFFCRARRPAPFSWRPALLKKPKWRPALLTKKKKKISVTWLLAVLPFLLHTHSVDCAVHLLLSHSRAPLVSSALFHPFTALIMLFSSVHRAKVPFWRSVQRAKVPFSDGTLPFWKPGQNTVYMLTFMRSARSIGFNLS